MFLNNKRKIAIFVLFFFMFSFPIKLKESYANPLAYEVVAWGLAAVLTAAGIMVETGDTESLLFAVQDYYDSLKAPEKAMYERMAIEASERGNAGLSDYLWNNANKYVKSKYNTGDNIIENVCIESFSLNTWCSSLRLPNGKIIEFGYSQAWGDYIKVLEIVVNGVTRYTVSNGGSINGYIYPDDLNKASMKIVYNNSSSTYQVHVRYYTYNGYWHEITSCSPNFSSIDLSGGQGELYLTKLNYINFNPVFSEEFQYSTPVPPGTVPERRIAYPSYVFNPNNDIDGILEPLTGKTAQDIWGAAGAYTANTTTFDPVSGDNPILPWVPIADPSTFTPAGELPAEISATAPGVLDGTNSDLNSISGSLGSIWDILKTGFNALIDTIWTGISHLLDGLGSISLLLKSVFDLINSGISALVGAISSIWDLVYDGFASVATALRGILDQVANVAGYLNPASDTFFLRTALVPDVAVLNGFVDSLNINFQEKFQITAAYEEFQSYKDTDHESEFEDIYVDLPIWGMQCICKGEFVNMAGQQFKSVVAAFLIMLTVIFCFKRIATIGSK